MTYEVQTIIWRKNSTEPFYGDCWEGKEELPSRDEIIREIKNDYKSGYLSRNVRSYAYELSKVYDDESIETVDYIEVSIDEALNEGSDDDEDIDND